MPFLPIDIGDGGLEPHKMFILLNESVFSKLCHDYADVIQVEIISKEPTGIKGHMLGAFTIEQRQRLIDALWKKRDRNPIYGERGLVKERASK
jgi:hypothetical protein